MQADNFCKRLLKGERGAIVRVMAFMTYNPSIGRVLESGGVEKFSDIARRLVSEVEGVPTRAAFDRLHTRYVEAVVRTIRTSRGGTASYAQAAKPINVFLKVYVDWAAQLGRRVRAHLLPFLHVPLDSVLIRAIQEAYPDWYRREIYPVVRNRVSLSHIDRDLYWKWQEHFRSRWPEKPLLFDIAWALGRGSRTAPCRVGHERGRDRLMKLQMCGANNDEKLS